MYSNFKQNDGASFGSSEIVLNNYKLKKKHTYLDDLSKKHFYIAKIWMCSNLTRIGPNLLLAWSDPIRSDAFCALYQESCPRGLYVYTNFLISLKDCCNLDMLGRWRIIKAEQSFEEEKEEILPKWYYHNFDYW